MSYASKELLSLAFRLSPLLLELGARAGVLLGAACLLALVLRRASPATRCVVWQLAIVSVLALPALTPVLPSWRLPILPESPAQVTPRPLVTAIPPGPAGEARTSHGEARTPVAAAERRSPAGAAPDTPVAPSRRASGPWLPLYLVIVWIAGMAPLLTRALAGLYRARRMVRRCRVVREPELLRALEAAGAALGVQRRVTALVGPADGAAMVPMTMGVLQPAVLLPHAALEWPAERQWVVLLHELGHIRRADWVWRLLARLACVLYWWNPLVWWVAARLRVDTEAACDDLVLLADVRPSAYAEHLLEIVRSLSGTCRRVPDAMAVADRPEIEIRLRGILSADRPRGEPRNGVRAGALGACVLLVAPVASVHLTVGARKSETAGLATHSHEPVPAGTGEPAEPVRDGSDDGAATAPRPVGARGSSPTRRGVETRATASRSTGASTSTGSPTKATRHTPAPPSLRLSRRRAELPAGRTGAARPAASGQATPATPDAGDAWGVPVDGLQLSIASATSSRGHGPGFELAFRNVSKEGLMLDLGGLVEGGPLLDGLRLLLTDSQAKTTSLDGRLLFTLMPDRHANPYLVPLPAGSVYRFSVPLEQFRSEPELQGLTPGAYQVVAEFEGRGLTRASGLFTQGELTQGRAVQHWSGKVRSGPFNWMARYPPDQRSG